MTSDGFLPGSSSIDHRCECAPTSALPPLSDFYGYAMNSGSATGVSRESPLMGAVLLGALSYGALVTLAIGGRTGPMGVSGGIRTGAFVGFLLWFTADFMLFGVSMSEV